MAGASPAAAARTVEYLHIEANAGGSSGGHTALCFEDACYHYQQAREGLLRLHREPPASLDHGYRMLGNRTINALTIAVDEHDHARLLTEFESRYQIQEAQLDLLEELDRDAALLALLSARADGPRADARALRVPGTGYFSSEPPRADDLAGIRRRVAVRYGLDQLERLAARVTSELASFDLGENRTLPSPTETSLPSVWRGPARRHRELLAAGMAIEVLRDGWGPRGNSLVSPTDAPALSISEQSVLQSWAQRISDSIVGLFAARRPNWGYPALIAMARLLALKESVRAGRLMVVDVFEEEGSMMEAAVIRSRPAAVAAVRAERYEDLARIRREFFEASQPDELRWSRLELTANLTSDLDHAASEGRALRMPPSRPLPRASARRHDWPLPRTADDAARVALATAHHRRERYVSGLRSLYRYDLIRRNCATEIARVVAFALTDHAHEAGSTSDTVHARPLDFIPFVSARSVRHGRSGERAWTIIGTEERPSYRRMALAAMREREGYARVTLRESTPLTARCYRPNDRDPSFLFFTEETPPLRPLLGAANLAGSLLAAGAGVLTIPFDRGERVQRALAGAIFSLPELGFVTLRKGTYPLAPRGWLEALEHRP